MRIFRKIIPLAIIFAFFAGNAYSQNVTIKAAIKGEKLTVGDRFLYTNTFTAPSGTKLELVPGQEKLGDAQVLSPIRLLENQPAGIIVYACTLAVFQPGEVKIPTLTFAATDNSGNAREIFGDTLTVKIQSTLPPDTTGLQLADIKGPKKLRGPIWPYLLIPLLIAGLLFGAMKIRSMMRGKIEELKIPPVPPWDVAIQRLEELKKSRHFEFGRYKEFYFELSLIIRGYIEGRYLTPAVESTTYELENDAILKSIPGELYNQLFKFFWKADMIKFAKSIPTSKDADDDMTMAYDFVIKTKPSPLELDEKKEEESKTEAQNVQV